MVADNPVDLTLSDVCRHLKSGALTSEAVTRATLDRIDATASRFHAYAAVRTEAALERARQLDATRSRGEPLGALHGVPVAVKDLLFMEGEPTASGTRVMADFRPAFSATVVRRLEAAGAVIVGRTQLTEGAFAAHHPAIEPPRNPWRDSHWPGVSSSGSGSAVAARLCYGALGTDTGGSIRFPSASCGVVGIKPTYGRVSRHGAFPLAESLDHIGPMTRCVEDAARILGVIAGSDPEDPTAAPVDVPDYVAACGSALHGLRVGVDMTYVETGVDAPVIAGVQETVRLLESLGATVQSVRIPPEYRVLVDKWVITCGRETARAHAAWYPARRAEYGPVLAGLIDLGLQVSQADYDRLEAVRTSFRHGVDELFQSVHLLLMPCMPCQAPLAAQMAAPPRDDGTQLPLTTFTSPYDYSGHPTLSLPLDLYEGLPRCVQFVAPFWGEPTLVRAGAALEAETGRLPYAALP
ncbi:MAG: amidase [Pseudomonadales bacterium]|nr:amidase [Pseudomonadales bacterium]MCP5184492.1 amidase [Pseudomonadales bacterium]